MITILMASYNGEQYIKEQIDSLLSQTEQRFHLVISDDGSTDETLKILAEYGEKYPSKISVVSNIGPHGAKHNFMQLMIKYKDDYIMLCDQDDVWLKDKIEKTLHTMQECENKYGRELPLLVHTDLIVADQDLNIIAPSLRHRMNGNFTKTALHNQIIQNTLTGCTAMYNRALAEMIKTDPEYCVMHDWWLMLIASAFGKIIPMHESTALYRQHCCNVVGVRNMRSPTYMLNMLLSYQKEINTALQNSFRQAQNFQSCFGSQLSNEQKEFLADYIKIQEYGKIKRIMECCRLHTTKNGFYRKIAQLLFI